MSDFSDGIADENPNNLETDNNTNTNINDSNSSLSSSDQSIQGGPSEVSNLKTSADENLKGRLLIYLVIVLKY